MSTKYEIRQLVKSVKCNRLEIVADSIIERMATQYYKAFVSENPDEYFELVKVEHNETCLQFTKKEQTP